MRDGGTKRKDVWASTEQRLRNIFDQYSQPENRVTHALMTALNEDRALLDSFLGEVLRVEAGLIPGNLSVLEQGFPGEPEQSEQEAERRGIPDGWIYNEDGWCVFIECKVLSGLRADQIQSHRRTAVQREFTDITGVAIAPRRPASLPTDVIFVEWRDVYGWLHRHRAGHAWAVRAAEYLEIAEAQLIETGQFTEGSLTMFTGIPFGPDHPFTYLEGKRVLGLATGELKARADLQRLGVDPASSGRGAIKGSKGDRVWDFLSLGRSDLNSRFTKAAHLTLAISYSATEALLTFPNDLNTASRRELLGLGESGFQRIIEQIVVKFSPILEAQPSAIPFFRGQQRRWHSRSGPSVTDGLIEFDLRTATSNGRAKHQPRWLSAGYGAFADKHGSNYEFQVGMQFQHGRVPKLNSPEAVDMIAAAWIACEPLVLISRINSAE